MGVFESNPIHWSVSKHFVSYLVLNNNNSVGSAKHSPGQVSPHRPH
jgi:hypothetical protein